MKSNYPLTLDDYQNKFVAFVDILGFKNLIKSIEERSVRHETDFQKVTSILNFLDEESIDSNGQHDLPILEQTDLGFIQRELGNPIITYVSDCVIISTEGTFDGFKSLCNKLTKFSTDIATDGIFVRGAIVYGKVVHTGRILFGSGYQCAYELESRIAKNPRIIVDDSVLDYLKEKWGQFPLNDTGIKLDIDGKHYLRCFPFSYHPYYVSSWLDFLLRVKANLLYHLNTFDNRVNGYGLELRELETFCLWKERYTRELDFSGGHEETLKKYIWLVDEFNETIEFYSEFLLDEDNAMRISKIVFNGRIWAPEKQLGHLR